MGNAVTIFTSGVKESGVVELIGKDEQVDAQDYSGSVGVSLPSDISGEILSLALYSYVASGGSGSVQAPAGDLYIFDADPKVSSGDTALAANGAEHVTLLGVVNVGSGDWKSDSNGAVAYLRGGDVAVPFHRINQLYFSFRVASGAASLNDAGGDDEVLEMNAWWRQDA